MVSLRNIAEPVAKELKEFEPYFLSSMKSSVPLLGVITNYIYRRKGKQLRPMLVFLSAGATGTITNATYVGATMIELLHTATLIHDDVVDEAYERRGGFSINALWRSKIAVLAGDFLLSKGLLTALDTGEYELLKNMSNAVREMSEGELMQIERSRRMDLDEETYLSIIEKKTATLLASCCVNGAFSSGASPEIIESMRTYGINIGMAFQIKDDLFDYSPKGIIGKPIGNDIKEKKLTLPLIYALSQCNGATNREIRSLIRQSRQSRKALERVINFTIDQGGIEYTHKAMIGYKERALDALRALPSNECTLSLAQLASYIVEREK